MTDSITLIMFAFPAMMAAIFSIVTIIPKGQDDDKRGTFLSASSVNLFSSLLACVCWIIVAMTWPALATTTFMVTIAYLWYALSAIFGAFSIAIAIRMLGDIVNAKDPPRLVLKMDED